MYNNAANAYQNSSVQTASQAELTLMLYEGAIKFCNKALISLERNDLAEVNNNLKKAQRIIVEFRATLDHKYKVAEDFDRVYAYIYQTLLTANIKKDKDMIEEGLGRIREMRDTWKEVMRLNKVGR